MRGGSNSAPGRLPSNSRQCREIATTFVKLCDFEPLWLLPVKIRFLDHGSNFHFRFLNVEKANRGDGSNFRPSVGLCDFEFCGYHQQSNFELVRFLGIHFLLFLNQEMMNSLHVLFTQRITEARHSIL